MPKHAAFVQLVPLALWAGFIFLLNAPPPAGGPPGVRADSPPLFLWSIATIVGVVLGLRGPRSGILAAFCAALGIALSFGMLSQPDDYSSGFAMWFIAACGISVLGWIARLALAQHHPRLGKSS
jgi:peptidoglycan/LPS O-acetylase OafA/YrhL